MDSVIQYVLQLFSDEVAAQQFAADPEAALADAGLSGVTDAQLQSAASTAVPGLILGAGNPVASLHQAVSSQFGFDSAAEVGLETGLGLGGETGLIAWQAHLGGFLAGLLLCGPIDTLRPRRVGIPLDR